MRIKELRKRYGITLRELERQCGLSNVVISRLELGQRNPTFHHTQVLADFFACTYDYLLGKSDYGMIVELGMSDSIAILNEQDINKYVESGDLKEYVEHHRVWRIPSKKLEEILSPTSNQPIKDEIISEVRKMDEEHLRKTLKFIKEFL